MILKNEKIEKTCCFYVSDFHLGMILIPYINNIIEEKIIILTEKNLKKSVEILLSRMNLKNENKILKLNWEGSNKICDFSNIIIIGSNEFISKIHLKISEYNPISVLDCYDFEEQKNNINEIIGEYDKHLNTLGFVKY